jgi:hypothetical protein
MQPMHHGNRASGNNFKTQIWSWYLLLEVKDNRISPTLLFLSSGVTYPSLWPVLIQNKLLKLQISLDIVINLRMGLSDCVYLHRRIQQKNGDTSMHRMEFEPTSGQDHALYRATTVFIFIVTVTWFHLLQPKNYNIWIFVNPLMSSGNYM